MAKCRNLVFHYDPIFGMRFSTVENMQGYIISTPNKGKVKKMTTNLVCNSYFDRKPTIRK